MVDEVVVSRETETPPAPVSAQGVFSDALPLAVRYVEWLAGAGAERGLIGPREVPRLWTRHVLNCAALLPALPRGASVCDVGSGAGLPGLVLAIARADLRIVLLEPLLRRVDFLTEVVSDLGLGERVEVVRGRADALHGKRSFDVVTSRAVAPMDRLLRWSMPLVVAEGSLVVLKGGRATQEVEDSRVVWTEEFACTEPEVVAAGVPGAEEGTQVVRVAWADPSRVSLPFAIASSPKGRARNPARKRRRPVE